jgi:hypothetical protein
VQTSKVLESSDCYKARALGKCQVDQLMLHEDLDGTLNLLKQPLGPLAQACKVLDSSDSYKVRYLLMGFNYNIMLLCAWGNVKLTK